MKTRRGTSLTELLLVLTLVGILATLAVPQGRRGLDQMRVRSAREATLGMAMHARSLAIARGGADLIIDLHERSVSAVDGAGIVADQAQLSEYDVDIDSDGSSGNRVTLRFDGLGLGRMTSRTVRFSKGAAEAGLTFSSYGRIRRW